MVRAALKLSAASPRLCGVALRLLVGSLHCKVASSALMRGFLPEDSIAKSQAMALFSEAGSARGPRGHKSREEPPQ